ncbi:hypothetical protein MHU86_15945 [Fragilaria crotonensis]|nr:hypothetical protein MHU86_15945 [Fragilaria crotonensis]
MGNNQQAVSGIQPRPLPVATFDDYVQQLDAWEVDLLRHTDLFVDPYTACLELHQGFEAGSDGSEKYGTDGSFGWMISTSQGERVATGMGPSRGYVMDSYRAECSGMLSILRFLLRLSEYTNMIEPWDGTIGTDSQSMLDTIFGRDRDGGPAASAPTALPRNLTPLDPLIPEWDLLVEIRYALTHMPGVKLVYVKGHQDKKKAYNRLTLRAQLNVDADDLAGRYQDQYGRAHPYALMTPNTGAFLVYPEEQKLRSMRKISDTGRQ